jgi:hypothetical protein
LLRPIDESTVNEAFSLLCRGFPNTPRVFWQSALDRVNAIDRSNHGWPMGYLLAWKGQHVGVLLTFASRPRVTTRNERTVVNLSSWYVEEECRWLAPMMLKRVLAAEGTVFTDLTPSSTLTRMLPALGFTQWTNGSIVAVTSTWNSGGTTAVVEPLHRVRPDACVALRRLMEDHAAADCIVGVLWHASGCQPIVFRRRRIKGIRGAELIFAPDRQSVVRHLPAIARFLAREKVFLISIDGWRDESRFPALFRRRNEGRYFKGDMDSRSTDYAYSELVYLRM